MTFTPKNLTTLEGVTFTLPLSVKNDSLNPDIMAIINWGDGSKEVVKKFEKRNNFIFTKLVDKKYTFPGNYTISIEIKKSIRDIFNDGFNNVGYYNMTVLPTTLSYAPSSNIYVNNLSQDNRAINLYLDDSGVPHSFIGKTLRSVIINPSNSTEVGSFTLTYSNNIPGKVKIELQQSIINSLTVFVNYYYSLIEINNTTQLSGMLLQGRIMRINSSANGLTTSV